MLARIILQLVLFAALFIGAPAAAAPDQRTASVGYSTFHDRLATSGTWSHNPRWGEVWRPNGLGNGFRPYFDRGHWVYTTDYGWFWAADDDWGDIVYHYGRWVFDPDAGWIWIPGYVWAPAWVDWRFGDGYVGWMPAPPDAHFLAGIGIGLAFADWGPDFYGYRDWYGGRVGPADIWTFVGGNHFADPDFRRYAVPRAQATDFIARTRNVTRYSTVHGIVANRSISSRSIARLSGNSIRPVPVRTVLHGNVAITPARAGRAIEARERIAHPLAVHMPMPARSTLGISRSAHGVLHTGHGHLSRFAAHPASSQRTYVHHATVSGRAYMRHPPAGHFTTGLAPATHAPPTTHAPAIRAPAGHAGEPRPAPHAPPGGGKPSH